MDDFDSRFGVIVNRNPNYTNFQFNPISIPIFISLFPFVYIIPTCGVILRIIHVYIRKGLHKKDEMVNRHVFLVIILTQLTGLCFFLSDFFTVRIPSTGILTSLCYEHEPSHFLGLIFTSQIYFTYTDMIFPALLSIVRLVPIYYPNTHWQVNTKILQFSIPMIYLYPFFFIFFMIPALGVCRQYPLLYDFGAVYIHFFGSWNQMTNAPFEFVSCMFWLSVFLFSNFILHRKLRKLAACSFHASRHARYHRAEVSLTLTSTSMILAYMTNLVFLMSFLIDPRFGSYSVILRPFGTDLKTCVVPWVFYMTHPAFYHKKVLSSSRQRTMVQL